jgi:sialic acid synthase
MFKEYIDKNTAIVIAEVGQNHQGSLDLAREYIKVFAGLGADAIKFQTRCNKYLFSEEAYNKEYSSENSFGNTYGAHREKLELKPEWLEILRDDCKKHNVMFISTPFDEPSLEILLSLQVDAIKIASFDLGNLPFINKIAEANKPVIMSVGGGNFNQITSSIEILDKHNAELAILHCVSEYPCLYNRLGLNNIEVLKNKFSQHTIGLSDHFNGILSGPIAFMKGARIFEKHVTMNRTWQGTDHIFALEPEGFRKFNRDIKRVPFMMEPKPIDDLGNEKVFQKLGKSIIAACDIKAGDLITLNSISGRIYSKQYIPVRESNKIIGTKAKVDINKGDLILPGFIQNF